MVVAAAEGRAFVTQVGNTAAKQAPHLFACGIEWI
jgi:hypothetical protein